MLKKSKLLIILLALFIQGCSLVGNKGPSFSKCSDTQVATLHEVINGKLANGVELKNVDSWFFIYDTPTKELRQEVRCKLGSFTKKADNIVYLTFFLKDRGVILQYILDPEEDVLVEMQFAPVEETNFLVSITVLFPLNSALENLGEGKKKRVAVVDQQMGMAEKDKVFKTLLFLSNGKFSTE